MVEAFSTLDSVIQDDECETVKGLSDDGHSYAGTVVRGVLRGENRVRADFVVLATGILSLVHTCL